MPDDLFSWDDSEIALYLSVKPEHMHIHATQLACNPADIHSERCLYHGNATQHNLVKTIMSQKHNAALLLQYSNKKFERKYRDYIKRNGDKIGIQTCYEIST